MIVELREEDLHYPDLTPEQPYVVLGIEADDLRILNDQGRPTSIQPSSSPSSMLANRTTG